jgi:peptidyl-tRNA hydrolase, PTH1 family
VLLPQTFMNEAGSSAGPARGALGVPLERIVVVHDEIDLPFGKVEARLGGGLAGHKGLKSLKTGLGGTDFHRVRVGVGRPDTTDPEIVSGHVLGRFAEPKADVAELIERAADETERLIISA